MNSSGAALFTGAAAAWPNEPAGLTVLTDQTWDFGVPPNDPATDALGWYFNSAVTLAGTLQVVADPSCPNGKGHSLSGTWLTTMAGGRGPWDLRVGMTTAPGGPFPAAFRSAFVGIWLKIPSNWSDGGNAGTKLGFMYPLDAGDQADAYTNMSALGWNMEGGGTLTADKLYLVATAVSTSYHDDQWHRHEWLISGNTIGASDGYLRYWIDSVPQSIGHDTPPPTPPRSTTPNGLRIWSDGQRGWDRFGYEGTYGGGLNSPPVNMTVFMGTYHVSGATGHIP